MQHWNLIEIEAPQGSRSPVVLHSADEGRAVLIALQAGQELGDHQVKEHASVVVVEGSLTVHAGDETVEAGPGSLFLFEPNERHEISTKDGARILLVLAPWPGPGHFGPA